MFLDVKMKNEERHIFSGLWLPQWLVDHNNNFSNHQISYTNNLCKLINFRLISQVVFVIQNILNWLETIWGIEHWAMLLCCLMTKPFDEKKKLIKWITIVCHIRWDRFNVFDWNRIFFFSSVLISGYENGFWLLLVVQWKENYCFADAINFHFHYITNLISHSTKTNIWLVIGCCIYFLLSLTLSLLLFGVEKNAIFCIWANASSRYDTEF